jgi:hypothetical protein
MEPCRWSCWPSKSGNTSREKTAKQETSGCEKGFAMKRRARVIAEFEQSCAGERELRS